MDLDTEKKLRKVSEDFENMNPRETTISIEPRSCPEGFFVRIRTDCEYFEPFTYGISKGCLENNMKSYCGDIARAYYGGAIHDLADLLEHALRGAMKKLKKEGDNE